MNRNTQNNHYKDRFMSNTWNNITLSEFVKIRAILSDKDKEGEDKLIALAAVVQGVDEQTILDMPLTEVEPIFALVQELNTPPQRSKIRRQYQVGRWALRLCEAKDMSVAQWIDFQNYYREDYENHLQDILSVALVPIGKKYNEGYNIDELKSDLGGMFVADALAVCFFFQRKWLRSMRRILNFLVGWTALKGHKELRKEAVKVRKEVSAMLRSV